MKKSERIFGEFVAGVVCVLVMALCVAFIASLVWAVYLIIKTLGGL